MKNLILFVLCLLGGHTFVMSQTVTGSMTQTPCNNDGIYSVTTTGIPLPITYTYYIGGQTIIHSNVNSTTDQVTNIPMSTNTYISCYAASGAIFAFTQGSYTPSFAFNITTVSPTCPQTMGTITANQVSGTPGPFSYSWTNVQTQANYTGNGISVPVGSYEAEIIDQTTGCTLQIQDSAAYVYQLSTVTATITTNPANCTNGSALAVGSGGVAPYTYQWANGVTGPSISGLSQGYYPLTVTDAQGCQSNYLGAYISQVAQINVNTSITNATCLQTDGSAIAFGSGGVNPYTYSWSNGQTGNTATGLSGGNSYTVIATDANGCTGTGYAYVNSTTPITVTYTSTASQCTAATGSASLSVSGGTAPYTYHWYANPAVNSPNLSNIAPGSYSFLVTDAVGCVRSGTVVVNPVSIINAYVQGSTVTCPNTNGFASAYASGGQAPYTYVWNTGATTSSISGIAPGGYSCVITDDLGCSVTKFGSVQTASPINIGVSTTPVSCIYDNDGAASAVATGGTAPYTYSYTNGSNTSVATNLNYGGYWVTATDANGCSKSQYFTIGNANTNQNCYCTISGDVYVDADADCVQDPGENGVQNIMVHCSGQGYDFTDANGHYSFQVPSGTYTITQQINQYYPLAACQNNNIVVNVVAASGCNTVVDFANVINPLHDLKIVTINSTTPPIPGNNYQQKVIVKNEGTITESGVQMGYEQDSQLPFVSASLPSFMQLNSALYPYNYSVQSGFPSLTPNTSSVMVLNYNTPTAIPLSTNLTFYDSVASVAPIAVEWLLDNTPWNNVNTFETTVIGSYDPNYKEVSPRGEGPQGEVTTDVTEFDYTIHFQNEGTYFAQNIVVTDQLDDDFDWTTFRPGYSDYAYTTTVSETGLVTFTFPNINLPWKSSYGDALSSAFVHYSIQRKATLPLGTEFTNTANIYFDYNAPITTNTTLNTLVEAVGIDEIASTDAVSVTMELYPVPTSDNLNIRLSNITKNEPANLSIIDLMGNVVMSESLSLSEGTTIISKSLAGLTAGTYLTRVQFDNGSFIVKPIVLYNR